MNTLYMFPPTDEVPEDADVLAGEYVLGMLESGEAAAIRLRVETDPVLRDAIWAWQVRLVPMAGMLQAIEPPPALWQNLAREIGWQPAPVVPIPPPAPVEAEAVIEVSAPVVPPLPVFLVVPDQDQPVSGFMNTEPVEPRTKIRQPTAQTLFPQTTIPKPAVASSLPAPQPAIDRWEPSPSLRLVDRVGFWRATTAAALVLAVSVGGLAFLHRPAPSTGMAAIGVVNAPAPIYLAESDTKGFLRITPMALVAVPNGRDLQLWMLPPGSDAPVSLGVLESGGHTIALGKAPIEGTRFIVSLESHGGSKTGAIAGQVLYGGTFAPR